MTTPSTITIVGTPAQRAQRLALASDAAQRRADRYKTFYKKIRATFKGMKQDAKDLRKAAKKAAKEAKAQKSAPPKAAKKKKSAPQPVVSTPAPAPESGDAPADQAVG